jgi:hypothetical protein
MYYRLLKFCYVLAASAARNRLLFFLILMWPFTVLMKQTRQGVCAIKHSIFLRCLWSHGKESKYGGGEAVGTSLWKARKASAFW